MKPASDSGYVRAADLLVVRGVLGLALGIALLLTGGGSHRLLGFMGVYWLLSGIVTLRFVALLPPPRPRRGLFAGLVGLAAGTITIVARAFFPDEAESLVSMLLGTAIALTGIAHLTGGFELEPTGRWHPGVPMGILEVLLGAILLASPVEHGPGVVWLAAAWALIGGVVLVGDGVRLRRRRLPAGPPHQEDRSP